MKSFARFLIPVGLGVFAFVLHWLAVKAQLGNDFVVIKTSVKADEVLAEAKLEKFRVVADDFDRLKRTLVPWEERTAIYGLPVRRALEKGDLVFWQDVQYITSDFLLGDREIPLHLSLDGVDYEPSLLRVGNQIGLIVPIATANTNNRPGNPPALDLNTRFEELGPFRILSVGQRTISAPGEDGPAQARGDAHLVTLAVPVDAGDSSSQSSASARSVPEAARRLLAAKALRRPDGKNIVAMILYQPKIVLPVDDSKPKQ
jgi:hypothetical protein